MKPTICYQTDEAGIFLHPVEAYFFPMEERLNVPYLAVQVDPPTVPAGHRARWISAHKPVEPEYDSAGKWVTEEIPAQQESEQEPEKSEEEAPAQA